MYAAPAAYRPIPAVSVMTVEVSQRRNTWWWSLVSLLRARVTDPPHRRDRALLAARVRTYRRWEARSMLTTDPVLAAELHIGRPDVARYYDDGGLVDVNHVPAVTLMSELELSPAAAEAVVAERNRLGGFTGADEMLLYCAAVTPARLALIRDRLVFVPL
jgi:hypothetical protein